MKWETRIHWIVGAVFITGLLLTGCCGRRVRELGAVPRVGKIEQPLLDAMRRASDKKLFNIVVAMSRQVTEAEKRDLFHSITVSNEVERMELQRTNLIHALMNVARVSQAPLLGYLHGLESNGIVCNVRPMWIANMIGLQAPAPVIKALATSNEVEVLHLDVPRRVFQSGQVPWGLTRIGITPSVNPATIQQTVVVAVIDTGVDYNHGDLVNHIWVNTKEDLNGNGKLDGADLNNFDDDSNGRLDDVIGWDFVGLNPGTNKPEDFSGHGTQVAGIIVGDGTGGTRTGIAPQAKVMPLRESNTFVKPNTTEQECWLGIQYAVANKAHIINFSTGWKPSHSPAFETWRNVVQNATDAGVLFVTAAGNYGKLTSMAAPYNVTTPGRVACALAVGAIGSDNSVRDWSGKGPITWQQVSPWNDYPFTPGMVKPDLVAPGEGILTTQRNGGYVSADGTSMATPHVSGVAALLRGQKPALNAYDVRFILEESAVPMGTSPNSTAGWGRLNAASALAMGPIDPTPYDLSVTGLRVNPVPQANQPALFFATVTNLGGQVVGNAELQFYFADAATRAIADLNPLANGKPDPARFTYIGSYFVPVVGPKNTRHGRLEGVVRWTIPGPRQNRWWLGVRVLRGAVNTPEINPLNNQALIEFGP